MIWFATGFFVGMAVELALIVWVVSKWKPNSQPSSREQVFETLKCRDEILQAALRGELDGLRMHRGPPLAVARALRVMAEDIEAKVKEGQEIADKLCS